MNNSCSVKLGERINFVKLNAFKCVINLKIIFLHLQPKFQKVLLIVKEDYSFTLCSNAENATHFEMQ